MDRFRGQGEAGAYGEFMIETDWHVGRILDFLEKEGLEENTFILFTSDNGPETTWKKRKERSSSMPATDPTEKGNDRFMKEVIGFRLLFGGQLALLAPAVPIHHQFAKLTCLQRSLK